MMKFNEQGLFPKCLGLFSLAQLILYIPMHLTYMDFYAELGESFQVVFGAFISFMSSVAAFFLPLFAAAVLFISYTYNGLRHALPRVFLFSLPYTVYTLPTLYMENWTEEGVVLYSLLTTAVIILLVTVQIIALFGVFCLFVKFPKGERRFDSSALSAIESEEIFDFSTPFSKGLFAACVTQFLITVAPEIYSTASYVVKSNGTYRTNEIITIVLTFLFITVLLAASYFFTYKLKNKIISERLIKEKKKNKPEKEK